jgi:hypothetical protein
MTSLVKVFFSLIIVTAVLGLFVSNKNLYNQPEIKLINRDSINVDLIKQLHGLKGAFMNRADDEMQDIYPEGYIFMNALYGLAWCNTINEMDHHSELFLEGHQEIQNSFNRINSEKGTSIFDETLPLSFGAFYSGWSTYLLGQKLSIEFAIERDSNEVNFLKQQCEKIALSLKNDLYPWSYYGGVWPADGAVCVAALSIHDDLFEKKYTEVIRHWVSQVRVPLDENGLIPHSVNSKNEVIENARGSSLSLSLIFLKEIDQEFAQQQFLLYKDKFLDSRMGLTGIREYPKGDFGLGDVDSGPVLLQMGAAATIVGMQTMNVYGEYETSQKISSTIEAGGFPMTNQSERFYLFKQLPMADAFIAWSHSAMKMQRPTEPSFKKFHTYTVGMAVVLLSILWFFWKPAKT